MINVDGMGSQESCISGGSTSGGRFGDSTVVERSEELE